MGLFSGGSRTTSSSTTVPWKDAQPYLKYGMGAAKKLYTGGTGYRAYPGQMVAPFSRATRNALGGMYRAARGPNPLAAKSSGAVSGILGGATNQKYNDLYAGADNPHWAQAVQNQSDQIYNDVQRGYSGLGRAGSGADTNALVDAIGRYRTGALAEHWDRNIANQREILGDQVQGQLGAVAAAPGAYDQRFAPMRIRAQVGNARDQQMQNIINARMSRYQTNQQAPWNRLNAYNMAIGAGNPPGSGTKTESEPTNPLGGILGGALGGASLSPGMPWLGAIGGGLAGLLSGL